MAEQTNGNAASTESILKLSSSIVAAYVSNNPVPASELPAMIKSVHGMLLGIASAPNADAPTAQKPAVAIRKSVTPEEDRAKWGLPADYPMVAPNYAKQRSEFAKQIGLGRTSSSSKRRKRA